MAGAEFDPTAPVEEKLQAEPAPAPPPEPPSLEARIAGLIRANAAERAAVTAEWEIRKLAPRLRRQELSAALARMSAEPLYADVKAVVAPSGRLYLFSEPSLAAAAAQEKARFEEAKELIAEKVRRDSQQPQLTPAADLEPLFPSAVPEERAALLAALSADERFKDIQSLAGAPGELYYHSDTFLSGAYGKIMMRARAKDPALAIAELVRERARNLPRPTKITIFEDPVFGFEAAGIEAHVEATLGRAEYADVKRMVHPATGAIYLFSDRFLDPQQAWMLMDWDEVGAAQNP